jgi:hypothetical protein
MINEQQIVANKKNLGRPFKTLGLTLLDVLTIPYLSYEDRLTFGCLYWGTLTDLNHEDKNFSVHHSNWHPYQYPQPAARQG